MPGQKAICDGSENEKKKEEFDTNVDYGKVMEDIENLAK
jgi:hypothetical protein